MRLFGWDIKRVKRSAELPVETESRSADCNTVTWGEMFADGGFGGSVSQKAMLSISPVWGAVRNISEGLASLPFGLYEKTAEGSVLAESHPVEKMLRIEPFPHVTAYNFRRALLVQACFGNAYAKIHRRGNGRPWALELLRSQDVEIFERRRVAGGLPNRVYVWTDSSEGFAPREILMPHEVLHLRALSIEALLGIDIRHVHRSTFKSGVSAQDFAENFFDNGAHPSGALIYPNALNPQQRQSAESKVQKKHGGTGNVGKIMVLDAGVKYEKMGVNMEEAGLIDYRKIIVEDASRIFGVPVHMLSQMDKATFNNMELMNTQFVKGCLQPWAEQVEQEFAIKLLTSDEKNSNRYFFRHNLDGLMRGDVKSRAEYYNKLFNVGALSPDDIREMENMNRRPGGDRYFTPLNMSGNEDGDADSDPDTVPVQSTQQ